MSGDHKIQFGHSDSERLVLSNFKWGSNSYSLDADLRVGNFKGAARIHGHEWELENLRTSLVQMSKTLSGETEFENLEGQLRLRCSIGSRGAVHFKVRVADYHNQVECEFDTDLTSLDASIASLAAII